jgi:hypothetical protein
MGVLARTKLSRGSALPQAAPESATTRTRKARPPIDPQLQAVIGEQLRQYYADLLREPVPDRFLALVQQLGGPEGKSS